ncbi:zinc ribbon domain-containing protein [Ruminococcus bromii]|uniref:zinc ribbon domain-containing protein n=1 Tax=Ruminococcus bromii TaxID=40518 RepID=UPI0029305955|nr:zinc ribbon domain-containing protein [Ruminococcus bromii]MDE8725531.1 zinc ribbon domain-containing protein [Ruminococcus bromii]
MAKIKCPNCGAKYSGNFCPTCSTPAPEQPQKKKKKWVLPVVIALVIIIVVACAGGGGDETKQPSNVQGDSGKNSTTANNTGNKNQNNDSNGSNPSVDVTLAETEVYNKDGIVITATKIEDDLFGPTVTFAITNDSSKNIVVTTRSLSVNGYMMEASALYSDVAAGKKAKESMILMASELEQAGIDTVADIEFYINISDSETYMDIESSDLIKLSTSASGSFEQAVNDSGDVVYDSNGVRVVCQGLKQDLIWDGTVVFFMENNGNQPVAVYAENVSVNGYMVDVSLYSDLRPATRSISGMYILDLTDLEIESIDGIENIEFTLRIVNADNWNEIDTTAPIILEFE